MRILQDPPLRGAVNMARDEALLHRVGRGASPPTVRFYQWDPPTISLGYFQKYAEFEALPPPAGELDVVRRQTGGGAILHDRELTYSITVPTGHALLAGGPLKLYELAHDALIDALDGLEVSAARSGTTDGSSAGRGPFFCFARRHALDVLIGDDKLAGSAQRRTRHAVLQHGSIVLERRYEQQPAAVPYLFRPITADALAARMSESLGRITGLELQPGEWQPDELTEAESFVLKYAGHEWTRRT